MMMTIGRCSMNLPFSCHLRISIRVIKGLSEVLDINEVTLTAVLTPHQVDYNEAFRLYCTTRLPRPHYTPELSANVTLVDFTVTQAGLEDQLLGKLILKVRYHA